MADSNIERYLKQIQSAIYGKDVRQSIHDGIQQCYRDGKAGAVDLTARQNIEALKAAVGTPLSASSASNMTDTSKIYVYTGNEDGYQNGHWYYYYDSKWTDGGIYQSISPDAIGEEQLVDHAVSTSKLADGSVTKEKLGEDLQEELLSGGDASINLFVALSEITAVFQNSVFKSADTGAYDALSDFTESIKPEGLCHFSYYLTNCKLDNQKPYIRSGKSYDGTVTVGDNANFDSIIVRMDGKDITADAVTNMNIHIGSITGDVVITAKAKAIYLADGIARLNYVYSADAGDAYIDTEYIMQSLSDKMEIGVILPVTEGTSETPSEKRAPFFGVNADSAFSSTYSAIEVSASEGKAGGKYYMSCFGIGWFGYQVTSNALGNGYGVDILQKYSTTSHYITLTDGEQKLWTDEEMTALKTGQFVGNSQSYTGTESRIPPFSMWLFRSNVQDVAYNSAKKKTWRAPNVKITCFKVWDKDGSLIVNMRPAKRESDGVIGFYDLVRGRFFENACDTGELKGA